MPSGRPQKVGLPAGEAGRKLIDLWIDRLDTSKTPVKDFIELYRVPTKRAKSIVGKTMEVQFREYPLQTKQRATIETQWKQGVGGKVCSGKGRQEGMSTDALLLMWERFLRGGGGTGNFFSYSEKPTKEGFRLFQSFKRQTRPWVFTHVLPYVLGVTKSLTEDEDEELPADWRRSSSMQLELAFRNGATPCMLQCLTAGEGTSGSGSSPRWLLWDEFPKWDEKVKADPTSMSLGWADVPDNWWIVQGTGMGQDKYAEFFTDVWSAQSGGGVHESGFVAIFPDHGWLGHPDRREEFSSVKARAEFIERIGKDASYGAKDEMLLLGDGATPEELLWRRRKIASLDIRWDLQLCRREFPRVPSDMFESSNRTVFAGQLDILKSHEGPAAERGRRARTGELELVEDGKVRFVEVPHGPVLLFEPPREGEVYCFGCDPAGGKVKHSAANKEADFTVASFGPVVASPSSTVARLRGHLTARVAAEELFKLCVYFNGAQGLVERNVGEALIALMEDKEHGPWSGADFLLKQDSAVALDNKRMETQTGYFTSMRTRELVIAAVEAVLMEHGPYVAERGTGLDPLFISECLVFERDEKGRPEAARGHDDSIFAEGLREISRQKIIRDGGVELSSRASPEAAMDPLLKFYRDSAAQRQRELKAQGQSKILGAAFLWLPALAAILPRL